MRDERRWCRISGLVISAICLGLLFWSADRRVLLLARNTMWLGIGTCLVSVPIGALLAFTLTRTDLPLRRVIWLVLTTLLFLPLYLHAAAWRAGLSELGRFVPGAGGLDTALLDGWAAAVWIHAVWSVPWVSLIVASVLQMCEPELEEQALMDGTAGRVFWLVTIRRAMPGIVAAGLWVFLTTAGEMTVTDLYQIRTLAEELYTGFALSTGDEPVLGGGTAILFVGLLTGLAFVALELLVVSVSHVPTRPSVCFRLRGWRMPIVLLLTLVLLGLVAVPVGSLTYHAGMVVHHVEGQPVREWSGGQFADLLVPRPSTYRHSAIWNFSEPFGWTLLIGFCAANLSLGVAVLLAWPARRGGWKMLPAVLVASIGLAVTGPQIGLATSWLFACADTSWLLWLGNRTIAAPVLVATLRASPLPILICFIAFRTLNRDVLDAAVLEGANGLARMWHIGVRQRQLAVSAAWCVAFALACGKLSATIMVNPPGITTIPIRVFQLLHAGVRNQVAAVCLTSMAGILLLATLSISLVLRQTRISNARS